MKEFLTEKIKKLKQPDRREYTLMVVPHCGHKIRSLRIPAVTIKYSVIALCLMCLITIGTFISYRNTVNEASADKQELTRLRQVNATQNAQIEELAKSTAALQDDMNRLNKLDSDLRRMVNSEDTSASRGSGNRPPTPYTGQGGPVVKPQASQLIELVKELRNNAKIREQSLSELENAIAERNSRLAATPSIWPTNGEVTSRFGWRWGGDWHPGIDIANEYGTPVAATADGVVIHSGWYNGYGELVQIDHGNGIVTFYGHNSRIIVTDGQTVKKGQIISYMGSTGYSTGTHLHYEIRVNGTAVNPANFL